MINNLPPALSTDPSGITQTRPLFRTEKAFWYSWQLNPKTYALNTPLAFAIEGPLAHHALSQAVDHYCRHQHPETCAKIVTLKGQPHFMREQHIHIRMQQYFATSKQEQSQLMYAIQHTIFDLSTGPLARFALISTSPNHHIFIINCHHIIGDHSTGLWVAQQIAQSYNQRKRQKARNHDSNHPAVNIQYDTIESPTTNQKTAVHCLQLDVDQTQHHAIRTLAKSHHSTPFLLLTSLWGWLLTKHHTTQHLQLSYPINRRPPSQKQRPGCFIEPCTLTVSAQHQSLTDMLKDVHTQHRNNQSRKKNSPELAHARHLTSISALTQTPFILNGLDTKALSLPINDMHGDTWLAIQMATTTSLQLCVRTTLYTQAEAKQLLHSLKLLITSLAAQPKLNLNTWHPIPTHKTTLQATTAQQKKPLPIHTQAMDTWQFQLLRIWQDILEPDTPLTTNHAINTWAVSSLQALQAMQIINDRYQLTLPISWLLQHPTISQQATALAQLSHTQQTSPPLLQQFQQGSGGTLVLIHPGMGGIEAYAALLNHTAKLNMTVVGMDNPHMHHLQGAHSSIASMAHRYVEQVTAQHPGPYWLLGWSLGGVIAHSMAHHMEHMRLEVKKVYLLDAHALSQAQLKWTRIFLNATWLQWLIPGFRGQQLQQQSITYQQQIIACAKHELTLMKQHHYPCISAPTMLLKAMHAPYWALNGYTRIFDNGWHRHCRSFHVHPIPCHHFNIVAPPHVLIAAQMLQSNNALR